MYIDKEKLLIELNKDMRSGILRMQELDAENPRECISYHILKEETEYIKSLIYVINNGTYDVGV